MKRVKILADTREQTPLLFPENIMLHRNRSKRSVLVTVKTEARKLAAGDYTIDGAEGYCIVETKRSADEVYDNILGGDFARANKAFRRLRLATLHPILVCEFSQADLLSHPLHPRLIDGLAWAVSEYGLDVWFAGPRGSMGARRRTGEIVLRLLLSRLSDSYWKNLQ